MFNNFLDTLYVGIIMDNECITIQIQPLIYINFTAMQISFKFFFIYYKKIIKLITMTKYNFTNT
jgi:hypothetical protein